MLAIFWAVRYFYVQVALKKLTKDIINKRESQSNLVITGSTCEPLISEINDLFDEINHVKLASKQEEETFELSLHNITHDIRTPLTIASGYTQALIREIDNDGLVKIKQNLDIVSQRLEILLEYQHLLEANISVNLVPVNLSETVKESLLSFYDALSERNIAVSYNSESEAIYFNTDGDVLERILQNILGNVLKHGQDEMVVDLQSDDDKVCLIIKNKSQQSIKNLDKLTSRFYSENMSDTEKSSGLGLYITQELSKRINCDLSLNYVAPDFIVMLTWLNK